MPFYKRGFKSPYPGENHSILWEIAGVALILAILKVVIQHLFLKSP
jgi:hypothetical protein